MYEASENKHAGFEYVYVYVYVYIGSCKTLYTISSEFHGDPARTIWEVSRIQSIASPTSMRPLAELIQILSNTAELHIEFVGCFGISHGACKSVNGSDASSKWLRVSMKVRWSLCKATKATPSYGMRRRCRSMAGAQPRSTLSIQPVQPVPNMAGSFP